MHHYPAAPVRVVGNKNRKVLEVAKCVCPGNIKILLGNHLAKNVLRNDTDQKRKTSYILH